MLNILYLTWNLWISNFEAIWWNVVLKNTKPNCSLSLAPWGLWLCLYRNLWQVMSHSWRLQKEIFFYVNVGVVMSCSGRKSKGRLSETRCSAVRTYYTRAVCQITRAPSSYIHTNDWFSDVTKEHADNLPSSCAQTCKIWNVHTICDVDISVVHLTH